MKENAIFGKILYLRRNTHETEFHIGNVLRRHINEGFEENELMIPIIEEIYTYEDYR